MTIIYEGSLDKNGFFIPCGHNLRHDIRKSGGMYEVAYYIPGYGTDNVKQYNTLHAARAAITKYDKEYKAA